MECLACLGEGAHDLRDLDAIMGEHLPPEVLAEVKEQFGDSWGKVIPCHECEGTGVISKERHAELYAAAVAEVDQVIARFKEEGIV